MKSRPPIRIETVGQVPWNPDPGFKFCDVDRDDFTYGNGRLSDSNRKTLEISNANTVGHRRQRGLNRKTRNRSYLLKINYVTTVFIYKKTPASSRILLLSPEEQRGSSSTT